MNNNNNIDHIGVVLDNHFFTRRFVLSDALVSTLKSKMSIVKC